MLDRNWASKIRSDEDRLNTMIEWITERHLDIHGGYPLDCTWIGKTLAVADLDDRKERNQTLLVTYKKNNLIQWCKRAERYRATSNPTLNFDECLWETEQTKKTKRLPRSKDRYPVDSHGRRIQ